MKFKDIKEVRVLEQSKIKSSLKSGVQVWEKREKDFKYNNIFRMLSVFVGWNQLKLTETSWFWLQATETGR